LYKTEQGETVGAQVELHRESRWNNSGSRRLHAVRAAQNRDETTLTSLLEAYLCVYR
jgi:hypothetical protein